MSWAVVTSFSWCTSMAVLPDAVFFLLELWMGPVPSAVEEVATLRLNL
jgi:hypothetical protein